MCNNHAQVMPLGTDGGSDQQEHPSVWCELAKSSPDTSYYTIMNAVNGTFAGYYVANWYFTATVFKILPCFIVGSVRCVRELLLLGRRP
jgi:hypothetical protein